MGRYRHIFSKAEKTGWPLKSPNLDCCTKRLNAASAGGAGSPSAQQLGFEGSSGREKTRGQPVLAQVQAEHDRGVTSDAPCGVKRPPAPPSPGAGDTGPTSEFAVVFSLRKLCPLNSREGKGADGELGYYHGHPGRAWVVAGQANRTGCGRSRAPLTRRTPRFSESV